MTPAKPGDRYAAYHRVSDIGERDVESESYATEEIAFGQVDAWAQMRGLQAPRRYLDRDVSGSKMSRPALDQMLADLRAGVIDGVAVASVDRLSRADVGDALAVIKEVLELAPGRLAILDLGIDPATEFGEFGLTVLLALSRMQWRRFKRQWQSAQTRAIARGAWIGPAPFGYTATDAGTLVEDHETGPVVRAAFKIAAAEGLHAAMAHLQQTAPERRWRTDETRRLLCNRAYLGEVRLGELVNANAHEPLSTVARFEAAHTEPRQRRSNGDYPLSGIARCGKCSSSLVGALQSVHGRRYRRMRCSNPDCRGGSSINADRLESWTRETLALALADKSIRDSFSPDGLEEARDALEAAEHERRRYAADLDIRALLGDEAWREGATARSTAVNEARDRYQALSTQAARSAVLPAAEELEEPEQLARALAAMIDAIDVRPGRGAVDERASVLWLGQGLDREDVPGALAA